MFSSFFANKMGRVGAPGRDIDTSSDLRASADDRASKQLIQGLLRYLTKRQRSHDRRFLDLRA